MRQDAEVCRLVEERFWDIGVPFSRVDPWQGEQSNGNTARILFPRALCPEAVPVKPRLSQWQSG